MAQRPLSLTDNEARVLRVLLSVDMDRVGLSNREQVAARSVLKKLKAADAADREDRLTGGVGPKPVKAIGAAGLQARISGRVLPS